MTTLKIDTTKDKLLYSAEVLFAEYGFNKVSVRDLVQHAGTNLSSINYHFGSKEGLIDEIAINFIGEIFDQRLIYIEEFYIENPAQPISLDKLVFSFIAPVLEAIKKRQHARGLFSRLISRIMTQQGNQDSCDNIPDVLKQSLAKMIDRYIIELQRTLPMLDEKQAHRCILYMFSTVAMALRHGHNLDQMSQGKASFGNLYQNLDEIIAYCSSGIQGVANQSI